MAEVIITRILDFLKENHFHKSDLAKRMNITDQALNKILNRKTMSCDTLLKISQALDHDFFQYLRIDNSKEEILRLKNEIGILEKKIEKLGTERDLLLELIRKQKEDNPGKK